MKKILLIIVLMFTLCFSIFAQSGSKHGEELKIYLENHEGDTTYNYTFKAESQKSFRWHRTIGSPPLFTLTKDHTGGQFSLVYPGDFDGFNWENQTCTKSHEMSTGLYKISETNSKNWFKIDYRDTRYTYGGDEQADITIYFNVTDSSFEYTKNNVTYELNEGQYGIWWFYDSTQVNSLLCTKPTCLSISDSSNHPYLTWEHNQDPDGVGEYDYEVWRLIYNGPHPIGTFSKIATVSAKNYYDTDINIGDSSWSTAWYKVRSGVPYDSWYLYSGYSDIADIDFEGMEKNLADECDNSVIKDYLSQNNPNPYNPSTNIIYSIARKSNVIQQSWSRSSGARRWSKV